MLRGILRQGAKSSPIVVVAAALILVQPCGVEQVGWRQNATSDLEGKRGARGVASDRVSHLHRQQVGAGLQFPHRNRLTHQQRSKSVEALTIQRVIRHLTFHRVVEPADEVLHPQR